MVQVAVTAQAIQMQGNVPPPLQMLFGFCRTPAFAAHAEALGGDGQVLRFAQPVQLHVQRLLLGAEHVHAVLQPGGRERGLLHVGVEHQQPDDTGDQHEIWVVDDTEAAAAVTSALASESIYIADGHHRYETCCNYRDEQRKADNDPDGKQDKDYNYTLMMCVLPLARIGQVLGRPHYLEEAPLLAGSSPRPSASRSQRVTRPVTSSPELLVLHAVRLKGMANDEEVAARFGV